MPAAPLWALRYSMNAYPSNAMPATMPTMAKDWSTSGPSARRLANISRPNRAETTGNTSASRPNPSSARRTPFPDSDRLISNQPRLRMTRGAGGFMKGIRRRPR